MSGDYNMPPPGALLSVTECSHGPELAALRGRVAELSKENDFLRAVVGNSDKACVYCGLGADEQGKCASGFPGCSRGDDQMLCREVGVALERDELRAEVERLAECEADARRYRWLRTERYMFREGAVVTCDSQPEKVALWVKCPVTNDAREVDAAIDAAMAGEKDGET